MEGVRCARCSEVINGEHIASGGKFFHPNHFVIEKKPRLHVLVCGGSGYLGGSVVKALKKKGCVVRVIVRNRARFDPSIQKLCDDIVELQKISDLETLKAACEGIDCVISCMGNRSNEKSHNVTDVDYQGNCNLLDAAEEAGTKHFIFVTALHGDTYRHLVPQYEAREKVIEKLQAQTKIAWTVFRSNMLFKETEELFHSARKGTVFVYGKGTASINPIDGSDLAEAIVTAAKKKDSYLSKVVEIGGPEVFTFAEIVELAKKIGENPAATVKHLTLTPSFASRFSTNFIKAFQMLPDLPKQQQATSAGGKEDAVMVTEKRVGKVKLANYFEELQLGTLLESNGDRRIIVHAGMAYERRLEVRSVRKASNEAQLDEERRDENSTKICWKFVTDDYDISFGIYFQKNSESRRVVLQDTKRIYSHRNICSGKLKVNSTGTYIFRWDNTYSLFTQKVLRYSVWALNTDESDEEVLRDESERQRISDHSVLRVHSGAHFAQADNKKVEEAHVCFEQVVKSKGRDAEKDLREHEGGFPEIVDGEAFYQELSSFPNELFGFWGIYDGHGGSTAADLAARQLHRLFIEDNKELLARGEYKDALRNAFLATERALGDIFEDRKKKEEAGTQGSRKGKEKHQEKEMEKTIETEEEKQAAYKEQLEAQLVNEKADIGGTSAVVAFLVGRRLVTANVGDCEALLVKRRSTIPFAMLSEKHSPSENPFERKRVQAAGGVVVYGRLFNTLPVSRSLGDFAFRMQRGSDMVLAEPYVRDYTLDPCEDEYVILGCRGLWEGLTFNRAISITNQLRAEGKGAEEISKALTDAAGKEDNLTAIVILFDWQKTANFRPAVNMSQELEQEEARLSLLVNPND